MDAGTTNPITGDENTDTQYYTAWGYTGDPYGVRVGTNQLPTNNYLLDTFAHAYICGDSGDKYDYLKNTGFDWTV